MYNERHMFNVWHERCTPMVDCCSCERREIIECVHILNVNQMWKNHTEKQYLSLRQSEANEKHANVQHIIWQTVITAKHKIGLLRYAINVILKTYISSVLLMLWMPRWNRMDTYSARMAVEIFLGFVINSVSIFYQLSPRTIFAETSANGRILF